MKKEINTLLGMMALSLMDTESNYNVPTSGRLKGKKMSSKKWKHRQSRIKMQKTSRKNNR